MIRFILFIPLILVATSLAAQTLKFVHGKPSEKNLNRYDEKYGIEKLMTAAYFDTLSHTSYHEYWGDDKTEIELLKGYVNETTTKNFEIKNISGALYSSQFANINNKFYALYTTGKKKESNVWVQEINADLVAQGEPQLLATLQVPSRIFLPKASDKIILIAYHEDKIQVSAFSNIFKPLWSKSFDLKTEDLVLQSVGATRDGYFYIGGHFSRKGEDADHFVIVYSTKTQQHQVNYFPKEEDIDLFNFNMTLLEKSEPVIGCMYTKKREMGYRVYKINFATLKPEQFATEPISEEFKKATVSGYKDINFGIVGIEKIDNGNIVFSIEARVVQDPTRFGEPGKSGETFYSSPANVICINDSGREQWDKLVRKFQRQGTASQLIGHYFFQHNNKVYIVYNDVNENFDLNPLAEQKSWILKEKNVYVAIAEIDEKGEARKLNLISKKPEEVSYFVVDQTRKISDNLFRLKITTPKGSHYSLLEAN
jgi:hypothetical protein